MSKITLQQWYMISEIGGKQRKVRLNKVTKINENISGKDVTSEAYIRVINVIRTENFISRNRYCNGQSALITPAVTYIQQ